MKAQFGSREKCVKCTKTVYPDDRVTIDNVVWHGSCFKCETCACKLSTNYASLDGSYYCKTHFKEKFKLKGKYDFGEKSKDVEWKGEKPSATSPGSEPKTAPAATSTLAPKPEPAKISSTTTPAKVPQTSTPAPKPEPTKTPAPLTKPSPVVTKPEPAKTPAPVTAPVTKPVAVGSTPAPTKPVAPVPVPAKAAPIKEAGTKPEPQKNAVTPPATTSAPSTTPAAKPTATSAVAKPEPAKTPSTTTPAPTKPTPVAATKPVEQKPVPTTAPTQTAPVKTTPAPAPAKAEPPIKKAAVQTTVEAPKPANPTAAAEIQQIKQEIKDFNWNAVDLAKLEELVLRVEKVAAKHAEGSTDSTSSNGEAASVSAYDEYVSAHVEPFLKSTESFAELKAAAANVRAAFAEQRKIISVASQSKKPDESKLVALFNPMLQALEQLGKAASKALRNDKFFNHLNALNEGLKCLTWVGVEKTPVPFVKEMLAAADFYNNKILMEYKKTDQTHVDWVNQMKNAINELAAYVKEHHTTGLTFNAKGKDIGQVSATPAPATPAPTTAGAPPPPPKGLPPPPVFEIPVSAPAEGGNDKFLEQIRSGAQLKHVTKEMKTKNQPGRSAVVPGEIAPKKTTTKKFGKEEKTGTPRCELVEDKKWVVEYQVGNKEVVIDNPQLKHTVYIYGCKDSVIQVKGKVNAISIDNCSKSAVIFDNVVAGVEFVNCKSMQAQANGAVATITVDKTDGCHLFLTKAALGASIVTSKSSEMNVNVPKADDEDDYDEIPVPEQYVTTVVNGKLVTTINSHI